MQTNKRTNLLLRTSAILWVLWGAVHILAGVMTMSRDAKSAVQGIADAASKTLTDHYFSDAAGAVINQHGFNLAWIGAFTIVGAVFIWKRKPIWVFVTAIVGGVTDIGYFIFMDLGGFVNFVPGTVMTIISAAAVILSFCAYFLDSSWHHEDS